MAFQWTLTNHLSLLFVLLFNPCVGTQVLATVDVDVVQSPSTSLLVWSGCFRPPHGFRWRPTLSAAPRGSGCRGGVAEAETNTTQGLVDIRVLHQNDTHRLESVRVLTEKTPLYMCIQNQDNRWVHQGERALLRQPTNTNHFIRRKRTVPESSSSSSSSQLLHSFHSVLPNQFPPDQPQLFGIRVELADRAPEYGEDGIVALLADTQVTLRLFGKGITNYTRIAVTNKNNNASGTCLYPYHEEYTVKSTSESSLTALITFRVPPPVESNGVYYFCVREVVDKSDATPWVHQGDATFIAIQSYNRMIPMWLSIVIILCCLLFSALFSGLNLGLMSMDETGLKIISNTGSETERRYARAIMPVRKTGNYLLCSILFGNVLVNSSLTILMDDLTSGLVAIIGSTLAIVIFGEIMPQAICSRHGLAVGAKTIYITKFVMGATCPLSYPISKLLDWALGEELGNNYTRERLKELVKITTEYNDLEKDEVNIISGALELRKKIVSEVMTKLEDVFMLAYETSLDFETVSEIMKQGYSRIPVYEGTRSNIVTVLYIKDLAFVDPDDNTPLRTLADFYQNPCNFVFEDTTLDVMFKQFKEGIKGHMAFVHRVNNEGEGDPFYETIGLITLEDVIEELIQAEIVDETDVWTDNRSKRRRIKTSKQDFTSFAERRENQRINISPQLALATFQYLSTVDAFRSDIISETILRRLLTQDVIYHVKMKYKEKARNEPSAVIYTQGKPADYFVLILEGRVEVTVGRENLVFESGPFTSFGTQALSQNIGVADSPLSATPQSLGSMQSVNIDAMLRHTFIPDYSVRAISEVIYVRIKQSLYQAAKQASLLERTKRDTTQGEDHFDDEVEKLLHSLDEDDRSQGPTESPTPLRGHQPPRPSLTTQDGPRLISPSNGGGGGVITTGALGNSLSNVTSVTTPSGTTHNTPVETPLWRRSTSTSTKPNESNDDSINAAQVPLLAKTTSSASGKC